jgi:hypothetical protein
MYIYVLYIYCKTIRLHLKKSSKVFLAYYMYSIVHSIYMYTISNYIM